MLPREDPLPVELFAPIKAAIAEVVTDKIRLLSSEGRAGQVGATA
jgi:hypothetical protein